MTVIDSEYIRSCFQCGAALMPENLVTHAEWHQHLARVTQVVTDQVRELDRLNRHLANVSERVIEMDARLAEAQEAVTVVERMVVSEVERRLQVREGWSEGRRTND